MPDWPRPAINTFRRVSPALGHRLGLASLVLLRLFLDLWISGQTAPYLNGAVSAASYTSVRPDVDIPILSDGWRPEQLALSTRTKT